MLSMSRVVTASARQRRSSIRVRFVLGAGKTIRGRLVDADNQPVPHRAVRLYLQDHRVANTYRQLGFSAFQPVTDKDGRFVFHGLPEDQKFRLHAYFTVDGQTFRSNYIQNITAGAGELELVLTTTVPQRARGR